MCAVSVVPRLPLTLQFKSKEVRAERAGKGAAGSGSRVVAGVKRRKSAGEATNESSGKHAKQARTHGDRDRDRGDSAKAKAKAQQRGERKPAPASTTLWTPRAGSKVDARDDDDDGDSDSDADDAAALFGRSRAGAPRRGSGGGGGGGGGVRSKGMDARRAAVSEFAAD